MKSKLQLLKDIAEFLNEETNIQTMLDGALKLLIDHSEFDTGWIFFITQEGKHELISHYSLPHELKKDNCHHLCNGNCWCVKKYQNNELKTATNIFVCSRLDRANKIYPDNPNKITHHATMPLISGEESYGLLNVATPHRQEYTKDELDLLESVSFQIGSTLKRIELNAKEQENIIIKERQRLARDLHDSVNQMLFSISITSHAAKTLGDNDLVGQAFYSIENTSKHAMKEMKALIWQLKPIGLENGIIRATEEYAKILGLNLEIEMNGFYNVSDAVEIELYRVIQESLNNIFKHADTKNAWLSIDIKEESLVLKVIDDGKGFVTGTNDETSYGFSNMRERLRKVGGELEYRFCP
jgi:two-component system NarL family sensor kinase